jgi:hypothetical protein
MAENGAGGRWQDQLYDLLRRHGVTQSPMCRTRVTAS